MISPIFPSTLVPFWPILNQTENEVSQPWVQYVFLRLIVSNLNVAVKNCLHGLLLFLYCVEDISVACLTFIKTRNAGFSHANVLSYLGVNHFNHEREGGQKWEKIVSNLQKPMLWPKVTINVTRHS